MNEFSESWQWFVATYHAFFSVFVFYMGAIFASFLNVVIYRLPNNMSIAWPGSHCPKCNHPIAWYDNVPIFSWLILRGRCRHCHDPISIRYPLVELTGAILAWTLFMHFGLSPYFISSVVLAFALLAISFIDLDNYYIPDSITFPGMVVGLLFSWWTGRPTITEALLGMVVGAGVLALILVLFNKITGREGMGWGDVKLLGMLGAFCGVWSLPAILMVGSLVGICAAVIVRLTSKDTEDTHDDSASEVTAGKNETAVSGNASSDDSSDDDDFEIPAGAIPFGPFLSIGALAWLYADQWIVEFFYRIQGLMP